MSTPRPEPPFSMWQFAWQLGYTLSIPLVGGVLLGHWLDGRLNTGPWLLIAGLLIGITLSSLAVVRQLNQAMVKINKLGDTSLTKDNHEH